MSTKRRLGRWLLYSLCLVPAVVMLGYYWLEYIPSQREYFVNLRFRALAVIGDQLRSKVERLASSLDYAAESGKFGSPPGKYISALVPELKYLDRKCTPSPQPFVEFGNPDNVVRFHAGKGCPAEASLSKIFSRFVRDELFDDVLIAETGGRVIYQRSTSSPRIVSVSELIKSPADAKSAWKEGSGADADAVRFVRLDESQFVMLVQPVRISLSGGRRTSVMACGLVRSERLAEESRHVPPVYLLAIFAPLLVIFLSGPFLKILLLTRTGRLAFHDMALLIVFTLIAGGLVTTLLVSWHQYALSERQWEPGMEQFADSLNRQIVSDVKRMRNTLERLDAELPANIGQLKERDRTDLLASEVAAKAGFEPTRFDFVFWTNQDGCQIAKWTTRRFNTQRVDQRPQDHFQNIVARRFWAIADEPKKQFTLQTLVSPTTSQLIVVMAMPSRHAGIQVRGCEDAESSEIVSASIVGPLPAVNSPLVPPGAGFAILEPNGRVLFHSSSDRNLHENLFEEIRSPDQLRAAVAMGAKRSVSEYYRGRKFQFHIQPVTGMGAIPWSIAVFRELEPRQATIGLVWGETLMLFLCLLSMMVASFLVLSLALRAGKGLAWRDQVDYYLARLWPDPARKPLFRRLAWELAAMVVAATIAVSWGSANAYRSSGWLLPFCFVMPLAAAAFAAYRVRKPDVASANIPPVGQRQPVYIVCLSLLLLLMAVLPTVGLFGVCRAFEARLHLMRWQQELLKSVEARRSRVAAYVEGSPALTDKAKAFLRDRFLPPNEAASAWDRQKYIARFWQTTISPGTARGQGSKPEWWQALLTSIRPEAQAEAMEAGALARDHVGSSACQWRLATGTPARLVLSCGAGSGAPVEIASTLPTIGVPSDPLWWLVALALLGGAYAWNCMAFCRLYMLDFHYTPLPSLTGLPAPASTRSHILVLGLPLARKDEAVRQWLGYTPVRVNLYATRFSPEWLEQTTTRLERELMAASGMAARAAGGGTTVQAVPTAAVRPWVHVSNLESKLGDPQERQIVADLLEKLILMDVSGVRLRLIVTSAVDPVFHFDSVLSDERKKIYEHPLPEPELQRLARLLHNFRKVQISGPEEQPPEWAQSAAGAVIYDECRHHQALLTVGAEVAFAATEGLSRKALLAMVAERARALYKLFWFCCTRSEKLLLIQLAQTGLFNPLCTDTLEELVRKGLILPGPRPRIMNTTFQRFLRTVEGPDTVREWESEAGESSWLIIRNVVLVLIALGLVVVALTQHEALQTVTAVLTGVGTVMAGLFRLTGFLTGRRSPAPEPQE